MSCARLTLWHNGNYTLLISGLFSPGFSLYFFLDLSLGFLQAFFMVADSSFTVAVMGLGYVGLPLAHGFVASGVRVIGIDNDPAKPEALHAEPIRPYLKHLGQTVYSELAAAARTGRFVATTDAGRLADADAVLVCVPTPLDDEHRPDLSYVMAASAAIGQTLRRGQVIVLESTTYPGTTREEFLRPLLAARPAWKAGVDYFVAFSPEREDPGNREYSTTQIPKLVGGLDAASTRAAADVYRRAFTTVIAVESAEVAEAAKILENTFRAVNIALVNELKGVFGAMGVDIWQVIEAARSKPFGFMPFYPGPGLGGHCIPIDPFYLAHRARQLGVPSQFIELAGRVNTNMPGKVVQVTLAAMDKAAVAELAIPRQGRARRVLVMGLAYKRDIDDVRESPSFAIIEGLAAAGCVVDYTDPHVPATHRMRRRDLGMVSVEIASPQGAARLGEYDAVVISTDHTAFDYAQVAAHARLVIDTRNAMRVYAERMGSRLVKA